MLQASLYSLIFLVCVVVLGVARASRVRQAPLLLASCILYLSWGPRVALVLLVSIVFNFLFGQWLRRDPAGLPLAIGVLFNLALLGGFKYLPEVAGTLSFSSLQWFSRLVLPLGISFWTFQALSYLFDLYRGEELDPSFVEFALYMAFFPVVISGPVCRMPEMLPQFRSDGRTAAKQIGEGLRRIAVGVLMMQLARVLGQGILAGDGINSGFDRLTHWSGPDVWCLAVGFGLQLFFDFAGYSHIAIGAATALGITLPENFARPFSSTSPSIFWTRWHMSLSFWIRDYVFLPLAMLRREVWWRNLALLLAMVLFGLWHKASWLFLLWGAYHGALLVLHRQVQQVERRLDWTPSALWSPVSWFVTMALISLGWVLFRANSLAEARQMLSAVVTPATYTVHLISGSLYGLVLVLALGYAGVLLVVDALNREPDSVAPGVSTRSGLIRFLDSHRWVWIPPLYLVALALVLVVTHSSSVNAAQFMYRNF